MDKKSGKGVFRLVQALRWSLSGLRSALQHEAAFRQEVVLCIVLIPLGVWLGKTGIEKALLVGCLFLVLIVELANSAVEAAVDRIGDEYHPLSGRAKDLGSAAVFLSLINVVVIWLLVLF